MYAISEIKSRNGEKDGNRSNKNKVDKIWDDIAAGGITNPITVIEQLTYLMFIRSLDEKSWKMRNLPI